MRRRLAFHPDMGDPQLVGARHEPQDRASLDSERGHEVAQGLVDDDVDLIEGDTGRARQQVQGDLIERPRPRGSVIAVPDDGPTDSAASGCGRVRAVAEILCHELLADDCIAADVLSALATSSLNLG